MRRACERRHDHGGGGTGKGGFFESDAGRRDLIALDVGLQLGDPEGFYALPRELQRDVFALVRYRAFTESPGRWALSSPARAGDILEMLAWTKGKRGLVEGPGNTPIGVRSGDAVEAAKAMARATTRTIQVVGGQLDETAAQAAAEAFAAARERKHWEQTTGSAKGAIDWWMNEEA